MLRLAVGYYRNCDSELRAQGRSVLGECGSRARLFVGIGVTVSMVSDTKGLMVLCTLLGTLRATILYV